MIHTPATRRRLDKAMESAKPHLRPVIEAVRDHKVGLLFVPQNGAPFRLPDGPKRAAFTIIGDDFEAAMGPEGFHMPSLRRIIRASASFAVVACEPLEQVYDALAFAVATTRKNVLLIETQPEAQAAWTALVRKLAPGRPLTIAQVKGTAA